MSTVIVLAPVIVANWGTISAAIAVGVAAAGFTTSRNHDARRLLASASKGTREEIPIDGSQILHSAAESAEQIVVEQEGIRAIFRRDARGALKLCVESEDRSRAELRRIGEELIGRVTQQYIYHQIVTELKNKNMTVIDEEVEIDRTVRIRVRSR